MVLCSILKSPSYSLPPTNLSKLLMILLVFSLLAIAWIMAAALSLSLFLQIDCGKYYIRIPFRRSSRAVRTSKISDIKGIDPKFCTHKILMEDDYKPAVQSQRRVNPKIHEVIKKEAIKLLDAGTIYPISDSPWVSLIHCVLKKGGMTVVANVNNELIPTRLVTGWRVCIYYRKLNDATRKDHFPLPLMDQMLERPGENYFHMPYGTFAYRRMPFGLCNAPSTFQRCMMSIFHDMIEKTMEVFMDDFSVFGDNFSSCLTNLDKMLERCVRSFLGHAGFYRRFIQNFSKISRPMTHLLEKETPFVFSKECIDAFDTLKKKITKAPILVVPDWNLPFELMCDASDYAIGAVLGQRKLKHFQPIHYASKTMIEAQIHYTTTEKEMLAVGIDFMGTFPSSKGNKYILVAVDYLSKWVKEKALPTNDARVVVKFFKSLFSQFGIPRVIISDRGTHFCNHQFTRVMIKYGVTHRLATAYHPQTSGQVEVSNRGLKRILERTMGENHASWSDKLDDALWAFCTERTKKLLDSRIKNRIFNVGDQVLLFNYRLKIFSGKLKTCWSGPFTITRVFPYGTIELSQPNGLNFKVNGHCVKHYFGGDIPSNVASDLHTFLMDN
uniref:DNA-directed DNA polymerase n=1 Tax=Tanacetum cinerariifolium TaxID=118510 RepID=A0A6L2JN37_TANCI|nr:DNA-directed DNA polymerase [Tanacetum cinerariifolium]